MKKLLLLLFFTSYLSSQLNIMTFNIRRAGSESDKHMQWDKRKYQVASFLKTQHPEIIGLQEVTKKQWADLKNHLNGYQSFGQFRSDKFPISIFAHNEANPIFFKKDVVSPLNSGTFWINPHKEKGKRGWGAKLNRICTWGKFKNKKTNQIFWIFNTHLDHKSAAARAKGLELILAEIKKNTLSNDRVFILGDFNENIQSRLNGLINTYHFKNGKDLAKHIAGPQWTIKEEKRRDTIDFILMNKNQRIGSYQIFDTIGKKLSDHNAVMISII